MFKNKCPNCKSENIIHQHFGYTFKPNSCCHCGLEWEATFFMRIFFASWFSILGWTVDTNALSVQFLRSNAGTALGLGYLSLIIIVPVIGHFVKPYREWGGSEFARKAVNFSCLAAIIVTGIFHCAKS